LKRTEYRDVRETRQTQVFGNVSLDELENPSQAASIQGRLAPTWKFPSEFGAKNKSIQTPDQVLTLEIGEMQLSSGGRTEGVEDCPDLRIPPARKMGQIRRGRNLQLRSNPFSLVAEAVTSTTSEARGVRSQ
jgi:hypothetical protein